MLSFAAFVVSICSSSVPEKLLLRDLLLPLILIGDFILNACWMLALCFGEKQTALTSFVSVVCSWQLK